MRRKKISRVRSKKLFKHTADVTKSVNIRSNLGQRGGIKL